MIKILMNKTFFELDYEFYKKYPELALTCGATALVMLIIERKVYVFSLGDCKGYTFRNDVLFQLNLDHLPVFLLSYRAVGMRGCVSKTLEALFNTIGWWENAPFLAALANSNTKYSPY